MRGSSSRRSLKRSRCGELRHFRPWLRWLAGSGVALGATKNIGLRPNAA
jgi:hypothetical protein